MLGNATGASRHFHLYWTAKGKIAKRNGVASGGSLKKKKLMGSVKNDEFRQLSIKKGEKKRLPGQLSKKRCGLDGRWQRGRTSKTRGTIAVVHGFFSTIINKNGQKR